MRIEEHYSAQDREIQSLLAQLRSVNESERKRAVIVFPSFGEDGFKAILLRLEAGNTNGFFQFVKTREDQQSLDPDVVPQVTAALKALEGTSSDGRFIRTYQPAVTNLLLFILSKTEGLDTTTLAKLDDAIFTIAGQADHLASNYLELVRWRWLANPSANEDTFRRISYSLTGNAPDMGPDASKGANPVAAFLPFVLRTELGHLRKRGEGIDAAEFFDIQIHSLERASKLARFATHLAQTTRASDYKWRHEVVTALMDNLYFLPDEPFLSVDKWVRYEEENTVYALHDNHLKSKVRRQWIDYATGLDGLFMEVGSPELLLAALSQFNDRVTDERVDQVTFACYVLSANRKFIGDERFLPPLSAFLQNKDDPGIRYASLYALATTQRSSGKGVLQKLLPTEHDNVIREEINELMKRD